MSVTNYDGRLEQMADYCKSLYVNLAKNYNVYNDTTDNAYSVSLSSKFADILGIKMIGGKTLVWNQLVDTGTAEVSTTSGHKYYTLINGTASIVTSDGTAISIADDTADMVCDLTMMFGSGNEPATTSKFTEMFPAEHYAYNSGTLLSAGVTSVVSKDSDDATLQTVTVPASIQTLEGYGWSTGTAYNHIDYDRKVFVKKVGKVVLDGTEDWVFAPGNAPFALTVADSKTYGSSAIPNILAVNYPAVSYTATWSNYNKMIAIYSTTVRFRDISCADLSAWESMLSNNPIILYYELATPVETDISRLLTGEKITTVESSGSITFENQNGDDYRIPVPVRMEYVGV